MEINLEKMNYEQKYKEALERVKELLDSAKKRGHIIVRVEDIENTFPELKESEGERIRKEIIAIFKGEIPYTSEEDAKRYIAWLEKQSGQKSADKCEGCNNIKGCVSCVNDSERVHIEEAKPFGGKEDEYRIERLLGWLDTLVNYIHYDTIISLDLRKERIQQVKQLKTWLKSFKERYTWKP